MEQGNVFQQVRSEGQVHLTVDGVEALQTVDQFVEQELGLLVQGTDESVPLVEPQQRVHAPLQLGVPHVKRRHAENEIKIF